MLIDSSICHLETIFEVLRTELSSKREEALNGEISKSFEWKHHFCERIQFRIADLMVEVRGIKT